MAAGDDWSRFEIELIVADYLHMLMLELSGQRYSKTQHRNILLQKLNGRTETAIERKHMNISAVMRELSRPWIIGYKPMPKRQQALYDFIAARLVENNKIDAVMESAAESPAVVPLLPTFEGLLVDPPIRIDNSGASNISGISDRIAIRRDYFAVEANNRSLGAAGEEFVLEYERYRLDKLGEPILSKRVERVSVTQGDGLGFDVLSFDVDGGEKYIEVKTTAFGKEAPFYVTRNELVFSAEKSDRYHLYRLFEFRRKPRMFDLSGQIDERCHLDPATYIARFR